MSIDFKSMRRRGTEHEKRREEGMCEHEFQEEGRRDMSMRRGGTEGEH